MDLSSLEGLLADYGLLILFIGTVLEGETILLLAGFFAYIGYFSLWAVIGTAFAGAFLGHLIYYAIGRYFGVVLIKRSHRFQTYYPRMAGFLQRYGGLSVFLSQYLYGTRVVFDLVLGAIPMQFGKFVALQFVSNGVWAVVMAGTGFLFGEAFESLIGNLKRYQESVTIILVILMVLYFVIIRKIRPHKRQGPAR